MIQFFISNPTWIQVMLILFGLHFLADYPWQGDFLSVQKNRWLPPEKKFAPWYQALTAHAYIQAWFVGIATGSIFVGTLEFICHWIIDYAKCKGIYTYNQDQNIHLLCKICWALLVVFCWNHNIKLW